MIIIGVDYHPSDQYLALADTETGEYSERRLNHSAADWRRRYRHLALRRQRNIAKVAMARRLAVRLYWMWRNGWEYVQLVKFGSNAGQLGTGHGV